MPGILRHLEQGFVAAEVDVEPNEPRLHVRASEHPDGELEAGSRCHFDLVQQTAAVTQGGTVIEQPRRVLTAAVKDGPPVGAERLVYLAEQVNDTLRDLRRGWRGRRG